MCMPQINATARVAILAYFLVGVYLFDSLNSTVSESSQAREVETRAVYLRVKQH